MFQFLFVHQTTSTHNIHSHQTTFHSTNLKCLNTKDSNINQPTCVVTIFPKIHSRRPLTRWSDLRRCLDFGWLEKSTGGMIPPSYKRLLLSCSWICHTGIYRLATRFPLSLIELNLWCLWHRRGFPYLGVASALCICPHPRSWIVCMHCPSSSCSRSLLGCV